MESQYNKQIKQQVQFLSELQLSACKHAKLLN